MEFYAQLPVHARSARRGLRPLDVGAENEAGKGTEVFFLAPDNKLMAAAVNRKGSSVEVRAITPLFEVETRPGGATYLYDVSGA